MLARDVIDQAVEEIRRAEARRQQVHAALKPLRKGGFPNRPAGLLEAHLARQIPLSTLTAKVGGVDSGFSGEDLFNFNLVMVRAVGALFTYQQGKLAHTEYHPGYYALPIPHHSTAALQHEDLLTHKSLLRLQGEVATATALVENHQPEYVLLDGSIVPQHADKPRRGSPLKPIYKETIKQFEHLYALAQEHGTTLIACVEDSHNPRLRALLQEALGDNVPDSEYMHTCSDPLLMDGLLETGERSPVFTYAAAPAEHPVLKDIPNKWAKQACSCYLKPVPLDRPLRIEFLFEKGDVTLHADRLANAVHQLSCSHREYAYPAPLVEADLRAALKPEETQLVYDKIMDRLGSMRPMRMRRYSRPFT